MLSIIERLRLFDLFLLKFELWNYCSEVRELGFAVAIFIRLCLCSLTFDAGKEIRHGIAGSEADLREIVLGSIKLSWDDKLPVLFLTFLIEVNESTLLWVIWIDTRFVLLQRA